MNVGELINELKKFDPDMEVCHKEWDLTEIGSVRQEDGVVIIV